MDNCILIFPDQWRGDHLGCLGTSGVETPYLDRLAQEGQVFTRAYTPGPTCIAARASLMTGLSPARTGRLGYRDLVPWNYPDTLAVRLRDAGWQTMCSGKTHFYPQRARLGFEELALYDVLAATGMDNQSDYHGWLQRTAPGVLDTAWVQDSNAWPVHPWTEAEHLHPTHWTFSAAIDQLDRRDPTRPFFLKIAPHRPHPPYDPPLAWLERFADAEPPEVRAGAWAAEWDRPTAITDDQSGTIPSRPHRRAHRAYLAQLAFIDEQIGRLMRRLKQLKLDGNTWIVFASDHGEQLGDHHLWRKGTALEGSALVPLIVRPPGGAQVQRSVRQDAAVSLTDLMPTILELLGRDPGPGLDGASLAPLIRGGSAPERDCIAMEHSTSSAMGGWQALTDGCEKYIWLTQSGRELLFDLSRDPQELYDLSGDPAFADRLALWRGRLVTRLARRPQDGLSDGSRLIPGRNLPSVRPELLPV